jgi:hypothetical protein
MKPVLVLLILGGLGALAGCAAICKGPKSMVRLNVPTPIEFHNYSGYDADMILDGQHALEVTSGEEYLVEYQRGNYRDSMLLERKLLWSYMAMDFYTTLMIGFAIDLAGPGYTVDKDFIAFPPPPDSLLDTTATPRLNLYAYDGRRSYVRQPPRIVAVAHTGMSMYGFNFTDGFGAGLGYRVLEPMVVLAYCGDNVLMGYAPEGSRFTMNANITTFALESRFHPAHASRYHLARSIYMTGGLEYIFIAADSMNLTDDPGWRSVQGFSDRIPAASLGLGIAFQGFFLEARQHWGLGELHIPNTTPRPFSYFALRWGLNVEL